MFAFNELARATHESSNDGSLAVYIATLTRSVLALHETLNNKQAYAQKEKEIEEGTTGTTNKAWTDPGGMVMASTKYFSKIGTPTLATLAATMKVSAATTRHLYCQR